MTKKNVPEMISAMGLASEIVNRLVRTARARNVPDEALYALSTEHGKETIERMVDVLEEHYQIRVFVDYRDSLSTLLRNVGIKDEWKLRELSTLPSHDKIHRGVYEMMISFLHYDIPETVREEGELGSGRNFIDDVVLKDIKQRGFVSLNNEELLSLCAQQPQLSKREALFALSTMDRNWHNGSGYHALAAVRAGESGWKIYRHKIGLGFPQYSSLCIPCYRS